MKATDRNILLLCMGLVLLCTGCSYQKEPPKTEDADTVYVLPKGELPSDSENAAVEAAREEYNQHTK